MSKVGQLKVLVTAPGLSGQASSQGLFLTHRVYLPVGANLLGVPWCSVMAHWENEEGQTLDDYGFWTPSSFEDNAAPNLNDPNLNQINLWFRFLSAPGNGSNPRADGSFVVAYFTD